MIGITSYGFYVPKYRIATEEIAKTWNKMPDEIKKSLNITEKAVASKDEDVVTMAFEAAEQAIKNYELPSGEGRRIKNGKNNLEIENWKLKIQSVFFGSETFQYAVKPASTMIAEWLNIGNNYLAYDTEFACKAATGALISAFAHVKSKPGEYSLVCAADKANAKPNDALEFTAGSGANAWLVGSEHVILELIDSHSYSSDTPDFWRRAKADYPSHAGRFTGKPAYVRHITGSSQALLEKTNMKPSDFAYAVFHMPNGRFPFEVGLPLGFTKEQIQPSLVVSQLGNSYTASALMGLVSVLEKAQAGDMIFFASYGSGAGSDAMIFRATPLITNYKLRIKNVFSKEIQNKTYIDYATYLRFMGVF